MRRTTLLSLLLLAACDPRVDVAAPPASDEERDAYAVGLQLGQRLHRQQADVNPAPLLQGLHDALVRADERTMLLSLDGVKAELRAVMPQLRERERLAQQAEEQTAQRAAAELFAANRARPGVTVLPSGSQYRVLTEGEGRPPRPEDRVTLAYEARLLDGSVVDSSADRAAPTIVRLSRAPAAFREVVPRMKPGGTVELYVGAESRARGPSSAHEVRRPVTYTLRLVAVDAQREPSSFPSEL